MERIFKEELDNLGFRRLKIGCARSIPKAIEKHIELIDLIQQEFNVDKNIVIAIFFNKKSPRCIICGNFCRFGYNTCSHICGGKYTQWERHNNPDKLKKFISSCSESAKIAWGDMDPDYKKEVFKKVTKTRSVYINNLSIDERRKIFGGNRGFYESLERFYNVTDKETLEKFYISRGVSNRKHDRNKEEYEDYKKEVWTITERNYRKFKEMINPNNFKRGREENDHQLDHKVSMIECFREGIEAEIAGSVQNLEMLTSKHNASKNYRSSISINQLLAEYYGK